MCTRQHSKLNLQPHALHHADGADVVALEPGANVLRFRAAPIKAGLYAARGIAAQLGSLRLALPLRPCAAALAAGPACQVRSPGLRVVPAICPHKYQAARAETRIISGPGLAPGTAYLQ
jgi:hypothetical protein